MSLSLLTYTLCTHTYFIYHAKGERKPKRATQPNATTTTCSVQRATTCQRRTWACVGHPSPQWRQRCWAASGPTPTLFYFLNERLKLYVGTSLCTYPLPYAVLRGLRPTLRLGLGLRLYAISPGGRGLRPCAWPPRTGTALATARSDCKPPLTAL